MTTAPLSGSSFSLVGVGPLGESLGRWLLAGGARLVAVSRLRPTHSKPGWLPAGVEVIPASQLSSAGQDLLLVAVPDDELVNLAQTLAGRRQARVALHTSGSRDAEVLAPLARGGTAVGGLHPLRAFTRPLAAPEEAGATFWAVDGDPPARDLAEKLARAWGGIPGPVGSQVRPVYHLAATLAAGGAVTLLASALSIAERLGLSEAACRGFLGLAQGSLAQVTAGGGHPPRIGRSEAARAITGPLARGDRSFLRQLEALRGEQPELHPLAVLLALETLRQQSLESPLSPRQAALERDLRALCAQPGFLDPVSS